MLIKLYRNVFREEPPAERRELFARLYRENDVELLGVWRKRDNPLEKYMLTRFRDEQHYKEFIETIRDIPEYREMTRRVSEVRISNEVIDLEEDY